jgi:hypothetical protein
MRCTLSPGPGGDVDERQALYHDRGQAGQVQGLVIEVGEFGLAAEEALGLADQVLTARMVGARDAGEERRAVGLGRDQPEVRLALLALVDQVELVVALDRLLVRLRRRVPDRGQQQDQGRQALLSIHDQERRYVARRHGNRR